MVSRSTSSSYSLVSRSASHSEELSAATDSLGSVHYKIGKIQQEQLGKTRKEYPPSKRTRSFSHFSLKKQFRKNRTVSDNTILGDTRKQRFREKFDHLRSRIRSLKREEIAPPPDELIERADLSASESGQELKLFSTEERKAFLCKDSSESMGLNVLSEGLWVTVHFEGPLDKVVESFLDVEMAKQTALDVNARMIEARDVYRAQKKELKKKSATCTAAAEKEELNQRLQQLVPIKGRWIRNKSGRELETEQLKILEEPRLRLDLPKRESGVLLAADFAFSVVPTSIQFTLHKEGHLKYGLNGMLVMDLRIFLV